MPFLRAEVVGRRTPKPAVIALITVIYCILHYTVCFPRLLNYTRDHSKYLNFMRFSRPVLEDENIAQLLQPPCLNL
jgi:hypothetical protein